MGQLQLPTGDYLGLWSTLTWIYFLTGISAGKMNIMYAEGMPDIKRIKLASPTAFLEIYAIHNISISVELSIMTF